MVAAKTYWPLTQGTNGHTTRCMPKASLYSEISCQINQTPYVVTAYKSVAELEMHWDGKLWSLTL